MWASSFLPNELSIKERTQKTYKEKHGKTLLVDYLDKELKKRERIVLETTHWVWLVPYWATWPYETMLLPRRHVLRLQDLSDEERDGEWSQTFLCSFVLVFLFFAWYVACPLLCCMCHILWKCAYGLGWNFLTSRLGKLKIAYCRLLLPAVRVHLFLTMPACASVHYWTKPVSQNTLRKWVVLLNVS